MYCLSVSLVYILLKILRAVILYITKNWASGAKAKNVAYLYPWGTCCKELTAEALFTTRPSFPEFPAKNCFCNSHCNGRASHH